MKSRIGNLFVMAAIVALFAFATPTASYAQSQCVAATSGYLGDVTIKNRCSVPIDVKWCYMRKDGSDQGCRVLTLNPGFEDNTPQCYQCSYKVLWENHPASQRSQYYFQSDGAMLSRLRGD